MQRRYIPAVTMLSAGAVTCITCIASNVDKLLSLEVLLGVLVVFYIIGLIAKFAITKVLDSGSVKQEETEESIELGDNIENAEDENGNESEDDSETSKAVQAKSAGNAES